MIKLIWAMDKNNLVGKNNVLPWHYKEDLVYFKNMTKDQTVLMGMNTYDSLMFYYKNKKLPFGKKYVGTKKDITLDDCIIVNDVVSFLENNEEDLFVIGGKTIYELALPYADYLYVTIIDDTHEGDTYFPQIDYSRFNLISKNEQLKEIISQ